MFTRSLIALLATAMPALADVPDLVVSSELETFEYGILCFYDDDAPGVPMPFLDVSAVFAADALFDEVRAQTTLKIPGVPGVVMGVISSLPDGQAFDVISTITHTNALNIASADELGLSFDDTVEIDAWSLDSISNTTFGTFQFQARRGTQTIYDVTLHVVPPEEYIGAYPECLTPPGQ
jgi:hypothetical protein